MCTPNGGGGKKCMRPGPVTSNGYLNFLREYRQKKCGLTPQETVRRGAKEWNKLSCEQKAKYRRMGCNLASRKKSRKRKSGCGCKKKKKRVKRNKCKAKKKRRVNRCKPKKKVNKCKPKRRKVKRCKRKAKKRKCGGSKRRSKSKKCMRGGPITNNGYLNFLRWFRKCNCGLSPKQAIQRGARKWCSLPQKEKDKFNKMACKVSTSKRRRNSRFCRGRRGKKRC